MNASDEASRSPGLEAMPAVVAAPLTGAATCDLVVVGSLVANFAEYATPGEVSWADEIKSGEGAILRRGLKKIATFRDDEGKLIDRSAVCTNLGCIVHWNGLERCWDCPCHGSQFATDGSVLNGPAVAPLATVEKPAEAETA